MKSSRAKTASRSRSLGQERCCVALLLIDVMNDFEFEDADKLLRRSRPMAKALARLKRRAEQAKIPCIYVNDNFGRWRSDLRTLTRHCLRKGAPGRELVNLLRPSPLDYFVLKPQNSGFFSTVLETLLRHLGVETLILTGLATDNCVLYTAHDAYLRKFRLFVAEDCCAANTRKQHEQALDVIARSTKAQILRGASIPLHELRVATKEVG
jgi:nicotinamidase-related amidase